MAEHTTKIVDPFSGMETFTAPFHQSSFCTYLSCKRKFLFRHRLCLTPKRESLKPSATLGTFIHSILALGLKPAADAFTSNLSALESQMLDTGDEFGDLAKKYSTLKELWEKAKVVTTILLETFPPKPTHKVIFKEQYFQTTLAFYPFPMIIGGTLDRVILNEEDGSFWIRDYKSTSRPIEELLAGYRWSAQLWFYKLLFELTQDKPCRGFILDVVQTPSIKLSGEDRDFTLQEITKGKNKGEPKKVYEGEPKFENYLARCKRWYADNKDSTCRSFCEMFPSRLYRTLPPDLHWNMGRACQSLPAEINPDLWPRDMTGSACKSFSRICDYYPLCNSAQEGWPILIPADYTVTPPDDHSDLPEEE